MTTTVTISIFAIILTTIFVNEVLTHLLNWGLRKTTNDADISTGLIVIYFLKLSAIFLICLYYLK